MTEDDRLVSRMRDILGPEGFVHLCQELGGTRVYLPLKFSETNEIVAAVGRDLAEALSRELAPAWLRVPLARRERALYYRSVLGYSNARIARALGITETGVNKLFAREEVLPAKAQSGSSAQLSLL